MCTGDCISRAFLQRIVLKKHSSKLGKSLWIPSKDGYEKIESTKIEEIKRNSIQILRLLVRKLITHFPSAVSTELEKNAKNRVPDFERRDIPDDSEEVSAPTERSCIECPAEFRNVGQQ